MSTDKFQHSYFSLNLRLWKLRALFGMVIESMTSFDVQYKQAIDDILHQGYDIPNPWSGRSTKMLPGLTLRVDSSVDFPLLTLRKIPLKIFIAEQIWFLMGENQPTWLQQFTKIWDDFLEEDGTIKAAYGYRW